MATLHVFNPEHDLALASNLSNFTAPHAGRQLRADLGYLPAIWAEEGDYVLVDNVEDAERTFSRVMRRKFTGFVDKTQLHRLDIEDVEPWGWDLALRAFLLRNGVSAEAIASEDEIKGIRELSHRGTAVHFLRKLRNREGTVGHSCLGDLKVEVTQALKDYGKIVLKAPWSSSGRGIRFVSQAVGDGVDNPRVLDPQLKGWLSNVIARQGSVAIEPYYNKVKDFAMEFEADGRGGVKYLGLSLFHTENGTYTGNILATEEEKEEMLGRYIPRDLLVAVREDICRIFGEELAYAGPLRHLLYGSYPTPIHYHGPFGVDMMVVARDDREGFLLHPCVEVNLRRTMGHVALRVPPSPSGFPRVMSIRYTDGAYKLALREYKKPCY